MIAVFGSGGDYSLLVYLYPPFLISGGETCLECSIACCDTSGLWLEVSIGGPFLCPAIWLLVFMLTTPYLYLI